MGSKKKVKHIGGRAMLVVHKYFPNVRKVNDANKSIDIEVTSKDVSKAARKDHVECAMAVACKRARSVDGVIISRSIAYLIKGSVATRYILPPSVSREVVAFDRGVDFEPGSYSLSAVNGTARLGFDTGSRTSTGNGPKQSRHWTTNIRTVLGSDK